MYIYIYLYIILCVIAFLFHDVIQNDGQARCRKKAMYRVNMNYF